MWVLSVVFCLVNTTSHVEPGCASSPILGLRYHFSHSLSVATHLHTCYSPGLGAPPLDCFGTFTSNNPLAYRCTYSEAPSQRVNLEQLWGSNAPV